MDSIEHTHIETSGGTERERNIILCLYQKKLYIYIILGEVLYLNFIVIIYIF